MTALLVAANGGHLAQLIELADRITALDEDRLWVTFDSPQSRAALSGRQTILIPPVEERDFVGVLRDAVHAHRIFRRHNITAVISTGSGVALSFLPYAAARGVAAHYVESAARVEGPSLTGRIMERVPGIRLYVQYPHLARGRWRYVGSVFDKFCGAPASDASPVQRIVVTLGSGVHAFRRVVERLIAILPQGIEIFWQTGSTPVGDLPITAHPMVPAHTLDRAIRHADVVIAHAGCGSALTALNAGKYPILIPRRPQHGELVDDHQVELARFLSGRNLALHRDPDRLTFADVLAAAARRIERLATPPLIRLAS